MLETSGYEDWEMGMDVEQCILTVDQLVVAYGGNNDGIGNYTMAVHPEALSFIPSISFVEHQLCRWNVIGNVVLT